MCIPGTKQLSSDDLAMQRTIMAAERTMMAWVRTALALIGFGFTIYKFLDAAVTHARGAQITLLREQGPRRIGLLLIALGTIAVVMGSIEYFSMIRRLNRHSEVHHKLGFSFVMGAVIGVLGALLFITIVLNAEVF